MGFILVLNLLDVDFINIFKFYFLVKNLCFMICFFEVISNILIFLI